MELDTRVTNLTTTNFLKIIVMKAKEAPEKLYLLSNGLISYCRNTDEDVEYTRTDALIEKATWWLSKHFYDEKYQSIDNEGTWIDADELIEGFKAHMKGE